MPLLRVWLEKICWLEGPITDVQWASSCDMKLPSHTHPSIYCWARQDSTIPHPPSPRASMGVRYEPHTTTSICSRLAATRVYPSLHPSDHGSHSGAGVRERESIVDEAYWILLQTGQPVAVGLLRQLVQQPACLPVVIISATPSWSSLFSLVWRRV